MLTDIVEHFKAKLTEAPNDTFTNSTHKVRITPTLKAERAKRRQNIEELFDKLGIEKRNRAAVLLYKFSKAKPAEVNIDVDSKLDDEADYKKVKLEGIESEKHLQGTVNNVNQSAATDDDVDEEDDYVLIEKPSKPTLLVGLNKFTIDPKNFPSKSKSSAGESLTSRVVVAKIVLRLKLRKFCISATANFPPSRRKEAKVIDDEELHESNDKHRFMHRSTRFTLQRFKMNPIIFPLDVKDVKATEKATDLLTILKLNLKRFRVDTNNFPMEKHNFEHMKLKPLKLQKFTINTQLVPPQS